MSRRRYVSTDISVDNRIAQLAQACGDFAALLYTWMIPHAGDDGGITGDCDELRLTVVPAFKKKTQIIENAVEKMVDLGLLEREGRRLFFPSDTFYKYQSYISAGNRRVLPQNAEKLQNIHNGPDRRKTPQNAVSPTVTPTDPPSPSPSPSLSPTPLIPPGAAAPVGRSERQDDWEERYGKLTAKDAKEFREYEAAVPAKWFDEAIAETAANATDAPWPYCRATLIRCMEQGISPKGRRGQKAAPGSARAQFLERIAAAGGR